MGFVKVQNYDKTVNTSLGIFLIILKTLFKRLSICSMSSIITYIWSYYLKTYLKETLKYFDHRREMYIYFFPKQLKNITEVQTKRITVRKLIIVFFHTIGIHHHFWYILPVIYVMLIMECALLWKTIKYKCSSRYSWWKVIWPSSDSLWNL